MEERSRRPFGTMPDGTQVEEITLRSGGLTAGILTYGGAVRTLTVPGRSGAAVDVALGFDSLEDYRRQDKYLGALVGRVAETGSDWSTVRLVTDPALSLSVRCVRTGERLVSGGDFSLLPRNKLGLSSLPEDCQLGIGDEIVTLATRVTYPSGILIGTVESLQEDASGLWDYGVVRPAADLTGLTQVFCITEFTQED